MAKICAVLSCFRRNSKGAAAVEYGMIAGGIFLAIVASVAVLGGNLQATYERISGFFGAI